MTHRLSPVLAEVSPGHVAFFCPGCEDQHMVRISEGGWGYNGNPDAPTFTPSIAVSGHLLTRDANRKWTGGWERDAEGKPIPTMCHTYVTDGQIQFLSDCTHALAGQTVPIPPYPDPAPC